MSLKERVYSVLVVSCSEKFNATITGILSPSMYQPVRFASSISEARRIVADDGFDFIVINSPLPDEPGTRFAIDCSSTPSTVALMLVRSDMYEDIHEKVGTHGVFLLSKPTSLSAVEQAIDWLSSARERLRKLEKKTLSIEDRMEEIRIVNRAKFLLISELKMTEPDAHHYIERSAMDNCISKRDAAQNIIKLYS